MILVLAEKGVKTIDDLADLAADELIEMLGESVISQAEANRVIMAAREHWFTEEGEQFYALSEERYGVHIFMCFFNTLCGAPFLFSVLA